VRLRSSLRFMSIGLCLSAAACDLEVKEGDTVVLSNDGFVLGSFPAPGEFSARPAAQVHPGGTLIVEDASLLGGNTRVGSPETLRFASPAIVAQGGTLRIQNGLIRGGEVAFTRQLNTFVGGAPAVDATDTRIEMTGGTLSGGPAGEFLPAESSGGSATGGVGLVASASDVQIRGGVLRPGPGTSEAVATFGPPLAAFLLDSTFDVSGGDFRAGTLRLLGSRGRITGGRFARVDAVGGTDACLEIRGGSVAELRADGSSVFLFGSSFSMPEGPVTGSSPGDPVRVAGTLEDGSPLDVELVLLGESAVILARSGTRGCL
jgi:hypothetical protein